MRKVLITGGTGFIGSHVVRYFLEQQITVGCLVRPESDLSNISGLPVELRYGRLEDRQSLINALEAFDSVIHIAALARDWGTYRQFYETNVTGSLNLLQACLANQIEQVIITATNSVYGEESSAIIKNETSPHQPHYRYFGERWFPCQMNYYRETKTIAKEKAIEFAKERGLNLTIIEPVFVYGEREFHTGFYEYLKAVRSKVPFLPGTSKNKFHVVYAGDLARAYWLAWQKQLRGIHSFIIGNRQAESMDKLYWLFCCEAGLRKPKNLPKFVFYPIGFVLELIATVFRDKQPPLLTRGRVNMFYDNIQYSTSKAEVELGFVNKFSLEEGIAKTVRWYRENNLL